MVIKFKDVEPRKDGVEMNAKYTKMVLFSMLFMFVLAVTSVYTDTPIIGFVAQDTTWTKANSPYITLGNVDVKEGVTLVIEPGVTVMFNSGHSLIIEGTLISRGTAAENIRFTSEENKNAGAWGGILFEDSSIDAVVDKAGDYLSGSILQYCIIEFAGPGIKGNGASPFIDYCIVNYNDSYGNGIFWERDDSAGGINISGGDIVVIRNSRIEYNTGCGNGGITVSRSNSVLISNNIITKNLAKGYRVGYVTFDGYGGGINIDNVHSIIISDNTIISNKAAGGKKIFLGFEEDDAEGEGGGIYISQDETNNIILSRNTIENNIAEGGNAFGGGIYLRSWSNENGGKINLEDNNIIANATKGSDFAYSYNPCASAGGGVYIDVFNIDIELNIKGNNLSENSSSAFDSGELSVGGCIYINYGSTGGVYSSTGGVIDICKNTFSKNTAEASTKVNGYGGAIYIQTVGESTNISENTFTDNKASGDGGVIYISSSHNLTIINNTFAKNSSGVIHINEDVGSATINDNNFIGNTGECIYSSNYNITDIIGNRFTENISKNIIKYYSTGRITSNYITKNQTTYVVSIEHQCVFKGNVIYDNKTDYNLFYGEKKGEADLDAINNYWGVTTEVEIRVKIYDFFKDNKLAIVNIIPFLTKPSPNQPPVANAGTEQIVYSGQPIWFNGSNSQDPDGNIVSYKWNFGDGESTTEPLVSHRYRGVMDGSKIYTVTLTVEDDAGGIDINTISVTVTPLEKTVTVTHEPIVPIPNKPVYGKMTASYNWIHDDTYVVWKIHYESKGFMGIGTVSIWDRHSQKIPIPIWSDNIPCLKDKDETYDLKSIKSYKVGEDTYEGIEVNAFDIMNIYITGWAGISIPTGLPMPAPFFKSSSSCIQPDFNETPEIQIEPQKWVLAKLLSPGELRVYNSNQQITGLVDGNEKEDIPDSDYYDNTIIIASPSDSYRYEVVGTSEGKYGLMIAMFVEEKDSKFNATDIAIASKAVHQYTIDWDALSKGEKGVNVEMDTNGDGTFEKSVMIGNEFTQDVTPSGKFGTTWADIKRTELFQNYPNPFNPDTWIPFSLSKPEDVKIKIYSSLGRLVMTLDLGGREPGSYTNRENAAYWDGKNEAGEPVASGIYFYNIQAGTFTATKKMIIQK